MQVTTTPGLLQTRLRALALLELEQGSLLGGVYAYLDSRDRLVMVDGRQRLLRIRAEANGTGEDLPRGPHLWA